MPNQAKCFSCGAIVIWCHTTSGGRMPVNAEPSPNGNLMMHENGAIEALNRAEVVKAKAAGMPLYLSHFATCSAPSKYRKKKGNK